MKRVNVLTALGIAAGIAFAAWAFDGLSMQQALELQDATITAVHVGGVTGWNDNNRTYVRYHDGFVESFRGIMGEVGGHVRTYRTIGTCSVFGINGDMTMREAGRIRMASVRGGVE